MIEQKTSPRDILDFWYSSEVCEQWFNSSRQLDALILDEYEPVWCRAKSGQLDSWRSTADGCLALAIILDQFPLNMFRGQFESFATEQAAVDITKWAVSQGFDKSLPTEQLAFLYMPLMHSENRQDQDMSVSLFEAAGLKNNARFARHHRAIVERFGRFPHRNDILGRKSTRAELDWLASEDAFKG